jgi:hypothetical protein
MRHHRLTQARCPRHSRGIERLESRCLLAADLTISEILASNQNGLVDEDGDTSDWIEIHNHDNATVNLNGWSLSDDADEPGKWPFPDVTLEPGAYLVVFASDKHRVEIGAALHTNFKLDKDGEYLALSFFEPTSGWLPVSEFAPFPAQQDDVSYGRDPIDPARSVFFSTPTPGALNAVAATGVVGFSRNSGAFLESSMEVVLSSTELEASIYYTLDGSVPTESSSVYAGPITISQTAEIRARALAPGKSLGPVASRSYVAIDAALASFSSSLPLVVLETFGNGGDNPIDISHTEFSYAASLFIDVGVDGEARWANKPDYAGRSGIHIRGQRTANPEVSPKQPFSVELRDEADRDYAAPLLGMPADSDWILKAPYVERTLLNDALAAKWSADAGQYAVRTRFVEVFVNGDGDGRLNYEDDYVGVYTLMEKVKIGPDRIDIASLEPDDVSEPDVSGGYIFKIDIPDHQEIAWETSRGYYLRLHEPDIRHATDAHRQWIAQYADAFEAALYGSNYRDPSVGYAPFIDLDSWINGYLMIEFTKNPEAYVNGFYFHKDRNGPIRQGPIWDMNTALGSYGEPPGWVSSATGSYYNRLLEDIDFMQRVIDRWAELRRAEFATDRLFADIDGYAMQLADSNPRFESPAIGEPSNPISRNFAKFDVLADCSSSDFQCPGPLPDPQTYADHLQIMNNFVAGRLLWMDTHQPLSNAVNLPRPPTFDASSGTLPPGTLVTIASADPGTIYYSTDGSDPRLPGGAISPTAVAYNNAITIESDTRLTARVLRDGIWSGWTDAVYLTKPSQFVVSEIHYSPAPPTVAEMIAGFTDNDDFEFIELRNISSTNLDLQGIRITAGVSFVFPAMTLSAGQRALVVKNAAAFELRYGSVANVVGTYTGNLANEGERIEVLGPVGETTMDFTYGDGWHPLTDGEGPSLVIVDDTAAFDTWNDAASWRPSDYTHGSPGGSDIGIAPRPDSIRINELLLDSPTGQQVEFYNASSMPIDVSGFFLSDDPSNLTKHRLPFGLPPIAPGGYRVLNLTAHFGAAPFSLNGGELILRAADANGTITGFQTSEEFTAADRAVSQGWHIKSTGGHDFTPLNAPTLGAVNGTPRVGPVVINEVMYHPLAPHGEFVEIKNITAGAIDLQDWSFASGIDFAFGATTIAPGEHVLVVGTSPATFRARYAIPISVQIVGPFTGELADDGENVELAKPNATNGAIRVDRVNYNSNNHWPLRPQGAGPSLSRVDAAAYGNDAANWASEIPGGSPGNNNSTFDDTPPTVPTNLVATVLPGNRIAISWSASVDPQSTVPSYNVYRNGALRATVTTLTYTDTVEDTSQTHAYSVAAVNTSLVESQRSATVSARVLTVASATSLSATTTRLQFNSQVLPQSATQIANYIIPGAQILAVEWEDAADSVLLTSSPLTIGKRYRVVVNNIVSSLGTIIQPDSQITFTAGDTPGLLAEYFNDPPTNSQPNTDSFLPENLVLSRIDPNLAFRWNLESPAPGVVNPDYFSVRWTGLLRTLHAGEYRITGDASDGLRLWIWPRNDPRPATPLVDRWINTAFLSFNSAIALLADTTYNVQVEYYESTANAMTNLRWIVPGNSDVVTIPQSQLRVAVELDTTAPRISEVLVASSVWTSEFAAQLQAQGLGNGGVAIPFDGAPRILPWTNVDQIKVRFDSDVTVRQNDLLVGGINVSNYGVIDFDYDYEKMTATWTLGEPINFDRAGVALASTVTDLALHPLGGTIAPIIAVAAGDINGDGTVNLTDRTANLAHQFTSIGDANYDAKHDLTGDGVINMIDLLMLQQRFDNSLPAPSAAAAAVLLQRFTAEMEQSANGRVIRALRIPGSRRTIAAIDRAMAQTSDCTFESLGDPRQIRSRKIARTFALNGDLNLDVGMNLRPKVVWHEATPLPRSVL